MNMSKIVATKSANYVLKTSQIQFLYSMNKGMVWKYRIIFTHSTLGKIFIRLHIEILSYFSQKNSFDI